MELTFDQWMTVLGAMGSWLAAVGTIAASGVALLLAGRAEKVKLKVWAGRRLIVGGGSGQPTECVVISVTNLGERPVIIQSAAWRMGKGKSRQYAIQMPSTTSPSQFGKRIDYGENAQFMVNFVESPDWMRDFATNVVQDGSDKWLKTLRAQVNTSVGHTETVKPEQPFLDEIKQILETDRAE